MPMVPARFQRCLAALAVAAALSTSVAGQSERLRSVDPQAGRAGDVVTITGIGFGAQNVRVTVGGRPASLIRATGNTATFQIPEGTPPGMARIVATNPGGRSGEILFRVLEGVLLQGNPGAPAADALVHLPPVPAAQADIDTDGFLLTRLDVRLAPDATVGELNTALASINGGIVGMQPGVFTVIAAIPRQATAAELRRQASLLEGFPGIRLASAGREPEARVLPFGASDPDPSAPSLTKLTVMDHLSPSRFPAAWNASGANQRLLNGCTPVPVVVQDSFGQASPDWAAEFPTIGSGSIPSNGTLATHGFDVLTTLAANFDAGSLTGANPFQQCLTLRAMNTSGLSTTGQGLGLSNLLQSLPAGKVAVNHSFGYGDVCSGCAPADVVAREKTGRERAYDTMGWKEATSTQWNDFALAVAAGNEANKPLTPIYAAFGIAQYGAAASIATTNDPLLTFAGNTSLFAPPASRPEFPTLAASAAELTQIAADVSARGLDVVPAATNTILVGSTTGGADPRVLTGSAFSDVGADIHAVGECIVMSLDLPRCHNGTSYAAPQVAGLLSYLWLLSPELRNNRAASDAVRTIKDNARTTTSGVALLDAYAAVLSLDDVGALTPAAAPIRLALLDADGNGSFADADLDAFTSNYFDVFDDPVAPVARDHSQFDLNGDGFTGGAGTDRFDLDRTGSTQFGRSLYGSVQFEVGGERVTLSENAVTDLQILCYYAYSPLYAGSVQHRDIALANRCAPISVSVNPPAATIAPGATQQFTATVRGTTDPRVTWVLPAGGGTMSASGLFTAGTASGTFAVRAISLVDPNSFADATVTVAGAVGSVLSGSLTLHAHTSYAPGLSTDTLIDVTLTIQPDPVEPDETPTFVVTAITGTGRYTAEATSGCNRPPEVRSGTAVAGSLIVSPDLQVATLAVTFAGTSTHTSCNNPTTTRPFEGTLSDGLFVGTPVVVGGQIVAINFDRSENTSPPSQVLVQTGRLAR